MIPAAEKLIEKAQRGERLDTKERRHALSFLLLKGTETNVAMAELFKVSERQVRLDKAWLREQRANALREDDPGLVIADIALSFEKEVRDVERSKQKCRLGSRVYLEHSKTLFKMQLDKVKALQELGYYPKQLGNLTVQKFEYKAIVSKDGSVETRPANMVIDAEIVETKALPAATPERDTSEFENSN